MSCGGCWKGVLTMDLDVLIRDLRRLSVETGSLACLGCGHENSCGAHGCALIREAVEQLGEMHRSLLDVGGCADCKHDGTDPWETPCVSCGAAVSIVERWLKSHQDAAKDHAPDQPTPSVAVGRGDILDKARTCVCQDRNREYGEPEDGFKLIAALWEPVIRESCVSPGADVSVKPDTVALLMALLKIARATQNLGHLDNWVDLAGYAACGGEIARKEEK